MLIFTVVIVFSVLFICYLCSECADLSLNVMFLVPVRHLFYPSGYSCAADEGPSPLKDMAYERAASGGLKVSGLNLCLLP